MHTLTHGTRTNKASPTHKARAAAALASGAREVIQLEQSAWPQARKKGKKIPSFFFLAQKNSQQTHSDSDRARAKNHFFMRQSQLMRTKNASMCKAVS